MQADEEKGRLSPLDSATIFYEALGRHPSIQSMSCIKQAALYMKVSGHARYLTGIHLTDSYVFRYLHLSFTAQGLVASFKALTSISKA